MTIPPDPPDPRGKLLMLVAEDRARTEERLRKRDEARQAQNTPHMPGCEDGDCLGCGRIRVTPRKFSREEVEALDKQPAALVQGQDVTPEGHLAGSVTYTVFGWKTNNEEEDGLRRESSNPRGAAAAVRSMLDVGYCQLVISVVGDDGLVVFPDTP